MRERAGFDVTGGKGFGHAVDAQLAGVAVIVNIVRPIRCKEVRGVGDAVAVGVDNVVVDERVAQAAGKLGAPVAG